MLETIYFHFNIVESGKQGDEEEWEEAKNLDDDRISINLLIS